MISVIVPIYNVVQYLEQCISSICNQTYTDIEIILVDDGSNDGSSELCEKFQKQDSRIIVIHQENAGLVNARKTGISHAIGKYITFVDGDDWIEPDMYERMYQKIIEQNVDIVMCGRYEDTGNVHKPVCHGIDEGRYDKQTLLDAVYPRMIVNEDFFAWGIFPSVWDKLFCRESIYPFQMNVDERIVMGEDAACVYPCLLNAESIYVMHDCLYHYRQTTKSIVKQVDKDSLERKRFRILYQFVNTEFEKYASIYDLRPQWEKYVLFLMIARADGLYEGIEQLEFLFPFPGVSKGADIILYGAGTYGQRLYKFLQMTGFCNVITWVDRNYKEFQKMGLPVESPEILSDKSLKENDIVVTITYAKPRYALYQKLIEKYPKEKIHLIDEELVFSETTKRAMGLY